MSSILKHIKKVEIIEAKHLVNSTIINDNSILLQIYRPFSILDTVGLSSVETSEKIENKVRIHTSKLTVLLPEGFEVGNKKLCFRVTTVSGERFLIGTDKRPFPIVTFSENYPNSTSTRCGSTMTVTYSNTIPMLFQLD
jgi:hypothetical protein